MVFSQWPPSNLPREPQNAIWLLLRVADLVQPLALEHLQQVLIEPLLGRSPVWEGESTTTSLSNPFHSQTTLTVERSFLMSNQNLLQFEPV